MHVKVEKICKRKIAPNFFKKPQEKCYGSIDD